MKSILMSIQPKWCELIANGKKTIEIRKTVPKLKTPFKCYIYCTRGKSSDVLLVNADGKQVVIDDYRNACNCDLDSSSDWNIGETKVIGEFVCDKIEAIACHKSNNGVGFDYTYYTESKDTLTDETQLTNYDMQQYLGIGEDGECVGYALYIVDLTIYDKPKELGEFKKQNPCYYSGSWEELGCWERGCVWKDNGDCDGRCSLVERPPQSWMYVEELEEGK